MNLEGRLYRRSTGTFLIRPCSGTRATLETAYIRRGVLNVRIHGDNHVFAGYACADYPATSFATGPLSALVNRAVRAAPRPIRYDTVRIAALCAVLSSLRRLRGKSLRRGRDILSHSRS